MQTISDGPQFMPDPVKACTYEQRKLYSTNSVSETFLNVYKPLINWKALHAHSLPANTCQPVPVLVFTAPH